MEERIAYYRIYKGKGLLRMHLESIQGPSRHNGEKTKACQRQCFASVVLHIMLITHQDGLDRVTPAGDIAAIPDEAVAYVPDENHRNPSREAKHQ